MQLYFYRLAAGSSSVPVLLAKVTAGAPINISTEIEQVDLNTFLATDHSILIRIEGDSMSDVICSGDWVILTQREPKHDDIVIASLHGEYTIKRYQVRRGLYLVPVNESYKPKEVLPADDLSVLGVVDYIIRRA